MAEDILERLKSKEDELEAFINEARKKASSIKEEALKKAKGIRSAKMKEIELVLAEFAEKEKEAAVKEAAAITKNAANQAEGLKKKGAAQKEKAVEVVVRFINEGLGER